MLKYQTYPFIAVSLWLWIQGGHLFNYSLVFYHADAKYLNPYPAKLIF